MLSFFAKKPAQENVIAVGTKAQNTAQLEEVLAAAQLVFEDRLDDAEKTLIAGKSPYHLFGQGLMVILKGSLGFEEDRARYNALVIGAGNSLDEAEASSKAAARTKADSGQEKKELYGPGTDLKLCNAQAKLANAVRASLSEKMTEYLRGLIKIRKSYMALKAIVGEEGSFISAHSGAIPASITGTPVIALDSAHQDPEVFKSTSTGNSAVRRQTSFAEEAKEQFPNLDLYPNSPLLQTSSDAFVYSGSHLCFGVMLVVLSMVPTAFQQVLKMIGFRGNKDVGYRMLWQATRFHNIHGACAGLLLLSLYNAIRVACDIADSVVYPKQRCAELLHEMKRRYPRSVFWTLEQARMLASDCKLEEALKILERPLQNPVRQFVSLVTIERSLYYMFTHNYEACSQGFIESVGLSKYSQALYYYDAACSQVQLYRNLRDTRPEEAKLCKEKARKWLETAIDGVDRKQLYATELPFDAFVVRKVNKWKERAAQSNIDLVDAIGVSPIEEMIYFYGGHKWMTPAQLDQSRDAITWSEAQPGWESESVDEHCVAELLKAVIARSAKNLPAAKGHLKRVLKHEWREFKAKGCDNWPLPSAYYEMAVVSWLERDVDDPDSSKRVRETEQLLKKVSKWESYELDFRIILKTKSAQDVVANYKADNKL